VLNRPTSNFQTFRLNIYQLGSATSFFEENGVTVDAYGYTLFVFDVVKLVLYTVYFGKQQLNDIINLYKNCYKATFADYFMMGWNFTVSFMNIANFILFMILSTSYDVNNIVQANEHINSAEMSSYYQQAQLYDSILVLMNMIMLI